MNDLEIYIYICSLATTAIVQRSLAATGSVKSSHRCPSHNCMRMPANAWMALPLCVARSPRLPRIQLSLPATLCKRTQLSHQLSLVAVLNGV
mmetsp:Transcript_15063/g.32656  ORF Transcript_15063/g.32656 Transcript_15063/m.32656 type:complete len:92 (+) Transcript_15063:423-698(+)